MFLDRELPAPSAGISRGRVRRVREAVHLGPLRRPCATGEGVLRRLRTPCTSSTRYVVTARAPLAAACRSRCWFQLSRSSRRHLQASPHENGTSRAHGKLCGRRVHRRACRTMGDVARGQAGHQDVPRPVLMLALSTARSCDRGVPFLDELVRTHRREVVAQYPQQGRGFLPGFVPAPDNGSSG